MTTARASRRISAAGRFLRRCRGSSGAEFALVLPILVLMLFGTIEVGRAMHDYQLVDKSVRHAARFLSRQDLSCSPLAFEAGAETAAKNLALTGTIDGSGDYLLKYWTDPATIDIDPDCKSNTQWDGMWKHDETQLRIPVRHVTVRAEVPIRLQIGSWLLGNINVNVTVLHEELVIGDFDP